MLPTAANIIYVCICVCYEDVVRENVESLHIDASVISSVSTASQLQPIGQYRHSRSLSWVFNL